MYLLNFYQLIYDSHCQITTVKHCHIGLIMARQIALIVKINKTNLLSGALISVIAHRGQAARERVLPNMSKKVCWT